MGRMSTIHTKKKIPCRLRSMPRKCPHISQAFHAVNATKEVDILPIAKAKRAIQRVLAGIHSKASAAFAAGATNPHR